MKKRKFKNYLKTGILLLGISLLLWNCEKSDLTETIDTNITKSLLAQKSVKLSVIPDVKDFLNLKVKNNLSSKTGTLNDAIFDIDNILEVIDTLGNINYTFRFTLPNSSLDTFYNLVVGKTPTGELKTPFVLKYTCDETSLDLYIDNKYNFSFFKGTISLHKYTDFFEQGYFSKTEATNCPPELDQNGDPIPCEIQPIDGSSTGGSGVDVGGTGNVSNDDGSTDGSSDSNSGGGTTSNCDWYIENVPTYPCPYANFETGCLYPTLIIDCTTQSQKTETDENCPPCDTNVDGGIGVNTLTIESIRTTLKNELTLNSSQISWIGNSENDKEVTDIYNFLQNNNIDGIYTSGAISFAESVIAASAEGSLISSFPFFKYPPNSNFTIQYPKLTEYLKNKLPNVADIPLIVNTINDITGVSTTQIKFDLQWNQGPTIQITQLDNYADNTDTNTVGAFDKGLPNTLLLDIDYVNGLENNINEQFQEDGLLFYLGVVLLHEYVHYADNSDGIDYPGEEGEIFEFRVYGENINTSTAQWLILNKYY